MKRMLRDKVPTKSDLLKPKISENAREQLLKRQKIQKAEYDKSAKDMKQIDKGDSVHYMVGKTWEPAVVIDKHESPRPHTISNEMGHNIRWNRVHLQKTSEPPPDRPAYGTPRGPLKNLPDSETISATSFVCVKCDFNA